MGVLLSDGVAVAAVRAYLGEIPGEWRSRTRILNAIRDRYPKGINGTRLDALMSPLVSSGEFERKEERGAVSYRWVPVAERKPHPPSPAPLVATIPMPEPAVEPQLSAEWRAGGGVVLRVGTQIVEFTWTSAHTAIALMSLVLGDESGEGGSVAMRTREGS